LACNGQSRLAGCIKYSKKQGVIKKEKAASEEAASDLIARKRLRFARVCFYIKKKGDNSTDTVDHNDRDNCRDQCAAVPGDNFSEVGNVRAVGKEFDKKEQAVNNPQDSAEYS
jgi:hypothetical protein